MAKTLNYSQSVSMVVTGTATALLLGSTSQALAVNDNAKRDDYAITAGATQTIFPTDASADTEFVLQPEFLSGHPKYFDVKITHASGDSTFRAKTGMQFSILGTDTDVEVINPAGGILNLTVITFKRSS